jgi:hypothetical protein
MAEEILIYLIGELGDKEIYPYVRNKNKTF